MQTGVAWIFCHCSCFFLLSAISVLSKPLLSTCWWQSCVFSSANLNVKYSCSCLLRIFGNISVFFRGILFFFPIECLIFIFSGLLIFIISPRSLVYNWYWWYFRLCCRLFGADFCGLRMRKFLAFDLWFIGYC